ncbi:MAG: flagellar basal body L-ring protein FlgH, partial [Planctomycetota bacterium]
SIAGDIQTIKVSGIVRINDIAFDNTVNSERVADFRIVTKHKGVAAPYNKQGWLGGIFDVLWPF